MAKDAEAHAAEDKEQREKVEARNGLDSMVYNVEKMLKDMGDKVKEMRIRLKSRLRWPRPRRRWGRRSVVRLELNSAKERLNHQSSHKLAEAMYKAAAAICVLKALLGRLRLRESLLLRPEEPKKDEGVIDAEYVDVDKQGG